ncbi:hypothetical protein H8D98_00675 [bacterium]|nr:hypothetical protein [bacterium]
MKNQKTTHNQKRNFVWILTILMFIGLLGLASMSLAAEGSWTKKADMPTTRTGFSTSVVNGIIYAIGGSSDGRRTLSTVEAYDPATDIWTEKADMPTPRWGLSTSVVNGKIYAIGGANGPSLSTVEAYDPATDTWTKKANMPTARQLFSTSVVNDIIYAIGGNPPTSANEAYDPVTDTWTEKANMPTTRQVVSTSAVNGRIYVIGGGPDWNVAFPKGVVEEYDTGFRTFSSVEANGKLVTTWGEMKLGR